MKKILTLKRLLIPKRTLRIFLKLNFEKKNTHSYGVKEKKKNCSPNYRKNS